MEEEPLMALEALLLDLVPADGSPIGNQALRSAFQAAEEKLGLATAPDEHFEELRESLIDKGLLLKGRGRGGSVRLAQPSTDGFDLALQTKPEGADEPVKKVAKKKAAKGKKRGEDAEVVSYRHTDKRKNNPEVGMVKPENDPDDHQDRWCYDPHIDPALQFDFGRAQMEKLIDDALASGDQGVMRSALEELKRYSAPYLNWTGKAERTSFDVDTVSLHVHERIDPASILAAVRKKMKGAKGEAADKPVQHDWLTAPFENLPLRDAIDFYKHEKGWSNRLIAGDSLQVMNSLLQKEGMAGQVQMIYIDPPYGIKYGSKEALQKPQQFGI